MGPVQRALLSRGSSTSSSSKPLGQSGKKTLLVTAGVILLLAGSAAAVSAVLCSTALACTVSPLSMSRRGNEQGHSGHVEVSPELRVTVSRGMACPVHYASVNLTVPLLLGGAAASCSSGCQPRDSFWSESCKMDPNSHTTWGLCEAQQRPRLVELASSLSNGSMLHFHPCDLYNMIQGRTLWLIGDSHMKSTYTAIRCIMMDFWDHAQGECAATSDPELQLQLHKAELYAPRKLPLSQITEPRCIHLIGGGRICFLHAVRGEVLVSGDRQKPGVLEFVQQHQLASGDDVFYAGTGRWYTHNCTGFEVSPYNSSLAALAKHYESTKADWPHLLFGVPPFDHTTCNITFDYKKEAACPASDPSSLALYSKLADYAHALLGRQGIHVIDYMHETVSLNWAHLGTSRTFKLALDCLHYCRPGLPEMDVWFLYNAMKQQGIKPLSRSVVDATAESGTYQTDFKCMRIKPFL